MLTCRNFYFVILLPFLLIWKKATQQIKTQAFNNVFNPFLFMMFALLTFKCHFKWNHRFSTSQYLPFILFIVINEIWYLLIGWIIYILVLRSHKNYEVPNEAKRWRPSNNNKNKIYGRYPWRTDILILWLWMTRHLWLTGISKISFISPLIILCWILKIAPDVYLTEIQFFTFQN